MNPRCDCTRCESAHHHAFGGTYPCEGPGACIQCQPTGREANGRDDLETREFTMIDTRRNARGVFEIYPEQRETR